MANNLVIYGKKSGKDNNIIYIREEDFQIIAGKKSFGTPLTTLTKIQQSKVFGKIFSELFSYDDFSLWWFLHPSVFPEFRKFVNFTIKFIEFIEERKPTTIKIQDDFSKYEIIKQICDKKQIKLEHSKLSLLKFKKKSSIISTIQPKRYKKIFEKKTQERKKLFLSSFNSIPSIDNKILFAVSTAYRRSLINKITGKSEKREYIIQEIMDLIKSSDKIVGMDLDYTFKGNSKVLKERIESKIPWFPVEMVLNSSTMKVETINKILKKYKKIISDSNFQKLFQINGISLWPQLKNVFDKMSYTPYIPFYMNLMNGLSNFFETNTPKAIFLPYETGPIAQAIIIVANKLKIKTIGVAHSTIYEFNPMYSYNQLRTIDDPFGFPIPEKTLVHGSFSKGILAKQGYPENKIVVFGNPVFFNLNKIKTFLEKGNLHEKYHVKKNQKVILLGTEFLTEYYSTQGKYNYNSRMWEKLLENFGDKDEFTIILKPHPNENISIYEKIQKKFDIDNAYIIQGDLFELIYLSSVVVSVFSNIMTDALCFGKPVVRVTVDGIEHSVPYEKFSVVLSTDLDGLVKTIDEVFNNDKLRENLKKNIPKFIKEQNNIPEDNPEETLKKILEN